MKVKKRKKNRRKATGKKMFPVYLDEGTIAEYKYYNTCETSKVNILDRIHLLLELWAEKHRARRDYTKVPVLGRPSEKTTTEKRIEAVRVKAYNQGTDSLTTEEFKTYLTYVEPLNEGI